MMNISDLIRDTIVSLCKTNRPYNGQVEIDGIICISGPKDGQQLVIKVHECLESFGKETVETWINRKSLCNEAQNCKSPLIKSGNAESSLISAISEGDLENTTSDMQAESTSENNLDRNAKSLDAAGRAGETPTSEIIDNKISVTKHCLPVTLECKLCSKSFLDQESMEVHNELSHNLFTCHSCLKTFTSRSNLERHSRLHTGHKPYSCTICDKAFSRKDHLSNHMTKHAFKCSLCSKKFSDCVSLATHFSYDHGSSLTHVCQFCNEGFGNSPSYEDHLRSHRDCQCPGIDRVPSLGNGQKKFSCQMCSFSSADALAFYRHRLSHLFGNESRYSCILCNKPFDNLKSFMEHSMEHQNSMASQTLHINWLQHFSNHYKSLLMTGNSEPYRLSEVNQVPDVYLKELLHKGSNQSSKNLNEMEQSDKRMKRRLEHPSFVDVGSLKYQKRSSNYFFSTSPGVTSGPCKLKMNFSDGRLSDAFNSPADRFDGVEDAVFEDSPINLKMEKASERDDRAPGPHQCGVCQLWFDSFEALDNHCLEDHNRSACMFCSKTFAQRANRDRHLCLHTGKKPYSCVDCNEKFSRGDKLKMHRIKVHGVVYPSRTRDSDSSSWTGGNLLRNQDFRTRISSSPTDPNSVETNNSTPCDDNGPQIEAFEDDSKLQQDQLPSE